MFEKINQKKTLLDSNRPLPKYTIKSLREKLLLEWTYNTNAIEGNTLTINETKICLCQAPRMDNKINLSIRGA
jgi:Fic family protein